MNDEVRNGENQFYRCTFAAILTRKKHWENYFFPRSIWIWFRFLHFILRLIRKSFDLASIVFLFFFLVRSNKDYGIERETRIVVENAMKGWNAWKRIHELHWPLVHTTTSSSSTEIGGSEGFAIFFLRFSFFVLMEERKTWLDLISIIYLLFPYFTISRKYLNWLLYYDLFVLQR